MTQENSPVTVLVIDDDEIILEFVQIILKEAGYSVVTCHSGKKAVEYFAENHQNINVVLLDMVMPSMDGIECFHRLKEIVPDVYVILSSGFHDPYEERGFLNQGIKDILHKPFQMEELLIKIALGAA